MSDVQWIWLDRDLTGEFVEKPNMYYDSQNYNNGQQQMQAPAYKYLAGNGGSDVAVAMSSGSPMINYKEIPSWSWCSTSWSVISLFCCCTHIFGFFGLLCSIFSYVDHKSADYERSAYKRKCSWGCSITGIIITLLGVLAVILIFVVFPEQLKDTLKKINYNAVPLEEWQT